MDSRRKRDSSFISHAHSDHTSRHRIPLVTPNTALLLADYLKKSDTVTLRYHEPLETPEYTLTLYPAGHCLGSAQALVQSKATGERVGAVELPGGSRYGMSSWVHGGKQYIIIQLNDGLAALALPNCRCADL